MRKIFAVSFKGLQINKIRNEIIEKYSFEKMINQYIIEMKLEI